MWQAFVADPDNIGRDYLGRYVAFTTSGSTAEPAMLVQDRDALAVMFGLTYARSAGVLPLRLLSRIVARGARQAAVFAAGGHFLSATLFERRLRAHPFRRRYSRMFSVLDPLPELVNELNDFQPALLGTYASALSVLTDEQEAGRLHISPLVITSGGELLLPGVKRRAEQVFGAVVTETYNVLGGDPVVATVPTGSITSQHRLVHHRSRRLPGRSRAERTTVRDRAGDQSGQPRPTIDSIRTRRQRRHRG